MASTRKTPFFFKEENSGLIVKGNFMTLAARPEHVDKGEWLAHQGNLRRVFSPPDNANTGTSGRTVPFAGWNDQDCARSGRDDWSSDLQSSHLSYDGGRRVRLFGNSSQHDGMLLTAHSVTRIPG